MCRDKCLYPTETEYSAHVEKDTGRAATTNGNPHIAYQTDGDVEVLFIINETTFKYKIPANTKWEKGRRYIYNLLFNGKDITLENVSTSEWLPVEGNMENTIL